MEKRRLHSAKSIRIGIQTNFIFLKYAYAPLPTFQWYQELSLRSQPAQKTDETSDGPSTLKRSG